MGLYKHDATYQSKTGCDDHDGAAWRDSFHKGTTKQQNAANHYTQKIGDVVHHINLPPSCS